MNLKYVLTSGGPAIMLPQATIEVMMKYRQIDAHHREAGGQLFARFSHADTNIIEATKPKLLDRRSRHRFEPNRWLQQREIRNRHAKGLHFVGDWHTHPENIPRPSGEDIKSMLECLTLSTHELKAFIMILVGKKPAPAGLYVALVKEGAIIPLNLEI